MGSVENDISAVSEPATAHKQVSGKRPKQQAQPGPLTLEGMRNHLKGVFIGYREGDPTAGPLPPGIPEPLPNPNCQAENASAQQPQVIRLSEWTTEQLLADAASTLTRDPFEDLLPNPPGVPPGRIAYFTGQRPARKRRPASRPGAPSSQAQPGGGVGAENKSGATRTAADPAGSSKAVAETQALGQNGTSPAIASAPAAGAASRTPGSSSRGRKRSIAVSDDDLVLALQRYLGGSKAGHSRQEAPWAELGMSGGAPIFQGRKLDLQQLWQAVCGAGGFESVTANRKWSSLAQQLGAESLKNGKAASFAKGWYQKLLLPYERHLRETGGWLGAVAAAGTKSSMALPPDTSREVYAKVQTASADAEMVPAPVVDASKLQAALDAALGKL